MVFLAHTTVFINFNFILSTFKSFHADYIWHHPELCSVIIHNSTMKIPRNLSSNAYFPYYSHIISILQPSYVYHASNKTLTIYRESSTGFVLLKQLYKYGEFHNIILINKLANLTR